MKKIILSVLLLSVTAIAGAQEPVAIVKQGHFSVGGTTTQRPGVYDNSKFVGWAEQEETGQSYRADHAFVDFQIPADSKPLPLVYVHGYGGSGVCWQMTPDGRDGFSTLMLRRGWSCYVVDLPGRGRAGRTSAMTTVKPVADEMFWFDIWRIGIWPNYNEGVQFPKDSASLSQFFREMTPDLSLPSAYWLNVSATIFSSPTRQAVFPAGYPPCRTRKSKQSCPMNRADSCSPKEKSRNVSTG